MNHLITLSEDPSTKPIDKQKLRGYIMKWGDSQILLGCAVFHDILKPAAILCKCLQADELHIVSTTEAILRTTTSMRKLKAMELEGLPSVQKVLERIKEGQSSNVASKTYQGVEIVSYDTALEFLRKNYRSYIDSALTCLWDRIKIHAVLDIIPLPTLSNSWLGKTADASFGYEAIHHLQSRFTIPLQEAKVNCALLRQEWDDVVFYAKEYNLVQDPYRVV